MEGCIIINAYNTAYINDFSCVGVCQFHLTESDYKAGKTLLEGAVRKRRVMKSDSVPSVFFTVPKLTMY